MSRARYFGYGDFPFEVPHVDDAPVGGFGLSLADALRLYWGPQSWRLTMAVSGTVTGNVYGGSASLVVTACGAAPLDVVSQVNSNDENPATDENDLAAFAAPYAYPVDGFTGGTGTAIYTGPSGTSEGTGNDFAFFYFVLFSNPTDADPFGITSPRMVYHPGTGLYYPSYVIGGTAFGSPGAAYLSAATNSTLADPTTIPSPPADGSYGIRATNIDVTIAGASFVVPGYFGYSINSHYGEGYGGTTPPDSVLSGDATATLTAVPSAYWQQRGNDGVAIYDGATGARLTNPATGAPFTDAEIIAMPIP